MSEINYESSKNTSRQLDKKVVYDDGKYKISTYETEEGEENPLILTENGIEIIGVFFQGEGIQILNINSMKLLFVFSLKTMKLSRVVDLEYRTAFITDTPFGMWKSIIPNGNGDYIVGFVERKSGQMNVDSDEQSVGIFILNAKDLMQKIVEERSKINLFEVLEKEKVEQNSQFKVVSLSIDEEKNLISDTIHTRPEKAKTIRPKIVGKALLFKMWTKSSKVNLQVEEIVDNIISEEKWISEDEFQIQHFLNYNPRLKKTEIQLTNRDFIDMIQRGEKIGKVLYKTITMQCFEEGVDIMTEIREETWKNWKGQRQNTLAKQHYISVVKEQFKPYKSLSEFLKSKIKKNPTRSEQQQKKIEYEYTALIEPVMNEDGTRYSDEISETVANFEICFPFFYPYSILFFTLKDGQVKIEKITKETGTVSFSKFSPSFRAGLKELEKLI